MAARKLSPARRAGAKALIGHLYFGAGQTQAQICALVGVSQQQISLYKQELEAEWAARQDADLARVRQQELAWLATTRELALTEYVRSQADASRRSSTTESAAPPTAGAPDGELAEPPKPAVIKRRSTVQTEGRLGDPRYLDIIQGVSDKILKLYGLYAQGESTATVIIKAYSGVDMEQV